MNVTNIDCHPERSEGSAAFEARHAAAVDRGGDEAAFTSYGKVDVYADGYEVRSVVPGGYELP